MKTAVIVLFCLALMPYLMAGVSAYFRQKQFGKIDNKAPREQYNQLRGIGARAVAAQQNAWEALAIYSAALLAVAASGVVIMNLAQIAIIVLIGRILHAVFYLADIDKLRTLSFLLAVAPCFYLLYIVSVSL